MRRSPPGPRPLLRAQRVDDAGFPTRGPSDRARPLTEALEARRWRETRAGEIVHIVDVEPHEVVACGAVTIARPHGPPRRREAPVGRPREEAASPRERGARPKRRSKRHGAGGRRR